ncbi:MAG: biotin--[acetyl-CoA-carboxylase] ligase [Candidatus Izemoplasmataceae bacterium]
MINKNSLMQVDTIDSTNDFIRKYLSDLPNGFIIQSNFQTKGRGQRDNQWQSKPAQNLLFSFLIKDLPNYSYQLMYQTTVTLTSLLSQYGLFPKIKLPNDIYVQDKKIAGILIETVVMHPHIHYIVGVGLNVNERFDGATLKATSIHQETHQKHDKIQILNDFIDHFNKVDKSKVFSLFKSYSVSLNQSVHLNNNVYELIDFNDDFLCTITDHKKTKEVPCTKLKFDLNT